MTVMHSNYTCLFEIHDLKTRHCIICVIQKLFFTFFFFSQFGAYDRQLNVVPMLEQPQVNLHHLRSVVFRLHRLPPTPRWLLSKLLYPVTVCESSTLEGFSARDVVKKAQQSKSRRFVCFCIKKSAQCCIHYDAKTRKILGIFSHSTNSFILKNLSASGDVFKHYIYPQRFSGTETTVLACELWTSEVRFKPSRCPACSTLIGTKRKKSSASTSCSGWRDYPKLQRCWQFLFSSVYQKHFHG